MCNITFKNVIGSSKTPFIIRYVPTCFITLGIWRCSLACTLAVVPNSLNLKNV